MAKWMTGLVLAGALTTGILSAADEQKTKSETKDPVTGETIKTKSKVKAESDGDYKEKSKTKVNGHTVEKRKVKGEGDGDYKEHTKVDGSDGKYESKTKVDK